MIVRMDNTGLGNQSRELVEMLKPYKVLMIDSTPFHDYVQHPEWYQEYETITNRGFISDQIFANFFHDVDVIFSCETFYSDTLVTMAKERGIKTILQYNYEYLDYIGNPQNPLPDYMLAPSLWYSERAADYFKDLTKLIYLPPVMDHKQFKKNATLNTAKNHKKILHVGGKAAYLDRNGTEMVVEMLKHSTADYQLVIRSQSPLNISSEDPRITFEIGDIEDKTDLYKGFDAMIIPRRYGGLCLPMNEALFSGLPVFMTDISPNNGILPKEWLAETDHTGAFFFKAFVEHFQVNPKDLAKKIDDYMNLKDKKEMKKAATEIAYNHFSSSKLKKEYLSIINE